jgi:prepilin-type N-terminal cleavage/methylation domain-containing protein
MRTKGGWTLIELLVVIAIIIVLAGITYAVIMYARERASQARCISNLRQIGVALKLYMEDYKQADWDTEVGSINCEQIQDEQSRALVARWGFPTESLEQLISAGYLKGGEDVLRCRSFRAKKSELRVHYAYQLPIRITESMQPAETTYNGLCHLQRRMHEYPIVTDFHPQGSGGGFVFLILRLSYSVEKRNLGEDELMRLGSSLNL